ncbi:hypothetical protein CIHG_08468 [Coccidioides immitis H538.4]|uniref:Uncharacterized protein n=3 Tax=Coccidioides immitis TaxID=5501 RepID=A0A0J8QUK8_COCIT|nr:hypothetical protein CIRG_02736 [Coccidioides immitis RMSCC 2394]KMU76141.1 hypothetical protein CISG_05509 [Coccidioides immitis RMSCC 3703]KMU90657.1 hypothetical protein CIHG_08468 [Coccidioides immitis H538.4]
MARKFQKPALQSPQVTPWSPTRSLVEYTVHCGGWEDSSWSGWDLFWGLSGTGQRRPVNFPTKQPSVPLEQWDRVFYLAAGDATSDERRAVLPRVLAPFRIGCFDGGRWKCQATRPTSSGARTRIEGLPRADWLQLWPAASKLSQGLTALAPAASTPSTRKGGGGQEQEMDYGTAVLKDRQRLRSAVLSSPPSGVCRGSKVSSARRDANYVLVGPFANLLETQEVRSRK